APGQANYLMALARNRSGGEAEYALAWVDISTGRFRVATSALDRLGADILRVDPSELILPEALFQDPVLRPVVDLAGRIAVPQPASLFESTPAESRIAGHYGVATLAGFGEYSRAELSAIAGIIAYIERTQKSARPELERPVRESASRTMLIDPATRANLELVRTLGGQREGSLLKAIDRTVTGAGARLLAERLTAPLTDPAAIERRLDSVSFALREAEISTRLREMLKEV